jgi:hypothetical protein
MKVSLWPTEDNSKLSITAWSPDYDACQASRRLEKGSMAWVRSGRNVAKTVPIRGLETAIPCAGSISHYEKQTCNLPDSKGLTTVFKMPLEVASSNNIWQQILCAVPSLPSIGCLEISSSLRQLMLRGQCRLCPWFGRVDDLVLLLEQSKQGQQHKAFKSQKPSRKYRAPSEMYRV